MGVVEVEGEGGGGKYTATTNRQKSPQVILNKFSSLKKKIQQVMLTKNYDDKNENATR